jgi:COP9 signalosome complex subunit 6
MIRHPLPILNISEHLTRLKLQTNSSSPFGTTLITLMGVVAYDISVLGALLGTQNGREVEIVNTFELATEGEGEMVDHGFLVSRRDQCKPLLKYRTLFS